MAAAALSPNERGPTGTSEIVATDVATDVATGLTLSDVADRRARFGSNSLPVAAGRSVMRVVLAQFGDVMVILLLVAAGIAALVGETADLVTIVVIVVLNASLGALQEQRAERALASLRALAEPMARVRRAGEVMTVPAPELVPGDVVLIETGNVVPADLRLVEASHLEAAEAVLTGESDTVRKQVESTDAPTTDADGRLVYLGTTITHGRGTGIVIATASNSQLGRIATLLREESEPRTPLQRRLDQLGRRLSVAVIVICAAILAMGLMRGEAFGLMLMTGLSIAVAAIPEALPAVVAMTLAIGARRMARHNALVRRLPAVETLGSVTFICADKTGTLTENRMRVERVWDGEHDEGSIAQNPALLDPRFLDALAISNDAFVSPSGEVTGDPTEAALCRFASLAGRLKPDVEERLPRVAELSFSPERARMTTLHRAPTGGDVVAFIKGAPEAVLASCMHAAAGDGKLDPTAVLKVAEDMAREGLRVLAIATRTLPSMPADLAVAEGELTLLGLVGLLDPPRAEAGEAVTTCQSAGIRVVMITGDHAATALSIARRLGIATDDSTVVTGSQLRALTDRELEERVEDVSVYARVSPADKIRIVKALQAHGEFVAMTGDGVNDAPALRRANIGVAMGRDGTDVAREAAAMVLLDDNFATIVAAVREGRRVYDNVSKFIRYVLAGNAGEICALLLAPIVGLPLPLLPIQILWVNVVTDGLPGLALAVEPAERDIMRRAPRAPTESLFANGMWQHIVWVGLMIGVVTLLTQALALRAEGHWRTMTFTVLTFAQMAQVMAIRSPRESLFRQGLWSNRPLLGAVAITVVAQLAILYVPVFQAVFRTDPLTASELALVVGASSIVFAAIEMEKLIRRRRARDISSLRATGPSTARRS